ncbi:MAG: nucleotide exchange factor GrpE [Caldilineaceae bacterium]
MKISNVLMPIWMWTKAALQQAETSLQKHAEQAKTVEENAESNSWQERYQQLQEEVESLRKRWEQRYTQSVTEARHKILLDMLPLADHLDLALEHGATIGDEVQQSFLDNIASTRRAFMETLRRYGVEQMEALGQPFDPNLHEAIGHIVDANVANNHVAQVVQAGYLDGEKLLRPARVIVSAGRGTET